MLAILSRMKREAQRPQSSGPFQTAMHSFQRSTPVPFDVWERFIHHQEKTTTDGRWEKMHNIHSEARWAKSSAGKEKRGERERWYCLCWVMLSAAYLSYGFHTCLSSSSQGQTQQTLPTMTDFPSWRESLVLPATCICIGAATLKQIYHTHFVLFSGLHIMLSWGSRRLALDSHWKDSLDSARHTFKNSDVTSEKRKSLQNSSWPLVSVAPQHPAQAHMFGGGRLRWGVSWLKEGDRRYIIFNESLSLFITHKKNYWSSLSYYFTYL